MTRSRGLLVAGGSLVLASIAIGLLVTVAGDPQFDRTLVDDARSLRDGVPGVTFEAVTRVGYGTYLVPASLLVALAFALGRRFADATAIAIVAPLTVLLTTVLKRTFARARPEDGVDFLNAGYAVPSGHAASSAAFATVLLLTLPTGRRWLAARILVVVFAIVVAMSRVVLGVHWPTDVVAGALLGVGCACVVVGASRRIRP